MLLDASLEPPPSPTSGKVTDDAIAFEPQGDAAAALFTAFSQHPEATVELVLVPDPRGMSGGAFALRIADAMVLVEADKVRCRVRGAGWVEAPVVAPATHVALVKKSGASRCLVNGNVVTPSPPGFDPPEWPQIFFTTARLGGGAWSGGMLNIAAYHRALGDAELAAHAASMRARFANDLAPPRARLRGRLVESAPLPAPGEIAPYTGSLIECVYDVRRVIEGGYTERRVLVKHWALMDRGVVASFPRRPGDEYDLLIEPVAAHPELKGERTRELAVFDLEPWYDISPPPGRRG
jgi:hypothetical protein